jgi:3-oxoacyl-[acyl-carrier-protein] synthase-3
MIQLADGNTCIPEGQAVFKFAVSNMADVAAEIMEKKHLSPDDISWLVPHQQTSG